MAELVLNLQGYDGDITFHSGASTVLFSEHTHHRTLVFEGIAGIT